MRNLFFSVIFPSLLLLFFFFSKSLKFCHVRRMLCFFAVKSTIINLQIKNIQKEKYCVVNVPSLFISSIIYDASVFAFLFCFCLFFSFPLVFAIFSLQHKVFFEIDQFFLLLLKMGGSNSKPTLCVRSKMNTSSPLEAIFTNGKELRIVDTSDKTSMGAIKLGPGSPRGSPTSRRASRKLSSSTSNPASSAISIPLTRRGSPRWLYRAAANTWRPAILETRS